MTPGRWQQIPRLYHAALDREPDQRAGFLEEACGGDTELRRELESLLARDASAQHLLETPAAEVAARLIGNGSVPPPLGTQIGAYRIASFVGQGGMGTVFRALDTRLNRPVDRVARRWSV